MLTRTRTLPGERELFSGTAVLGLLIAAIVYQTTSLALGPRQIPVSLTLPQFQAQQVVEPVENGVGAAATLFTSIALVPAERLVLATGWPRSHSVTAVVTVPSQPDGVQAQPGSVGTDSSSGSTWHPKKAKHRSLMATLHSHQRTL